MSNERPETPHQPLLDDLEDIRDLLDDQIPTLNERAEAPTAAPAEPDEAQIPLVTERCEPEPAVAAPPAAPPEPATRNPFLPTEKLKQLAVERATIAQLFYEQLEDQPLPDRELKALEQHLRQETPHLLQQLTDELVEEALQEFSVKLENRLQQRLKACLDAELTRLLQRPSAE